MKFCIALFSPPNSPSSRRALKFAEAALNDGHQIVRLFLYQDAVHNASAGIVTAQDERDIPAAWQTLLNQHGLDGVVCIAAAIRRGVLNEEERNRYQKPGQNLAHGWELSGLGQLHEAAQLADRLVCFGGA